MPILTTAGLVAIRDRKLLLAFSNNKRAFYLPGGKTDPGETTRAALVREIREELNLDLAPDTLHFYTHIQAPAFGEHPDLIMHQDCFRYDLQTTPQPAAEIGALQWFDTIAYSIQPAQVPGVLIIMDRLRADNLID